MIIHYLILTILMLNQSNKQNKITSQQIPILLFSLSLSLSPPFFETLCNGLDIIGYVLGIGTSSI